MKLSEKIVYYRKRAGLNQEALADKLGVSRQAVSKWETGEAVPELNKVVLLAKVFGVTTDELLLDEAEEEAEAEDTPDPAPSYTVQSSNWVESVPGVIGRLLRRYGWLSGVYMAVMGAIFTALGALARAMVSSMTRGFNDAVGNMLGGMGGEIVYMNGEMISQTAVFRANNPVSMLGGFLIVIGVILMIAGVALAVILKKKSHEN